MKRFGTMLLETLYNEYNCLYTRKILNSTNEDQEFSVVNGAWLGSYKDGVVTIRDTGVVIRDVMLIPLYEEDFEGVNIGDYNDVYQHFENQLPKFLKLYSKSSCNT